MKILIAIPALNEEAVLRRTIESLRSFVATSMRDDDVTIVIADNGSTDGTAAIGSELAAAHSDVRYLRTERRGKGLAIRAAWNSDDADAFAFMDADLSTELSALPALVGAIRRGADVAIGSRFHPDSRVARPFGRRLFSVGYRLFARLAIGLRAGDASCGFKAASRRVIREIVPAVRDEGWFFDTELLVRAERRGFRIVEVPVIWREPEGRRSKVRPFAVAARYVRAILQLRRELRGANTERRLVFIVAAIAMVLTSIPVVEALIVARNHGVVWTGREYLSPGDLAVYLSSIAQAKRGALLIANAATTERLVPILNIFWLSVGLFARLFSLGSLAAYHLARLLLIPALAFVAYRCCAFFLPSRSSRIAAFLLFMFGSGLGLYASLVLPAAVPAAGQYQWPIDLWVGESNAFLSMMYSPHFVASLALLLAAMTLLAAAYEKSSVKLGAFAGLVGLVLFEFHPYHAPTFYAVGLLALLLRAARRHARPAEWLAYAAAVAISAPSVAYQYWLTHATADGAFMLGNGVTLTPAPWHVMIGFGVISVLWIPGYIIARKTAPDRRGRWDFLLAWVIAQALLIYAPLAFQRRLLEGLEFPLVILSTVALAAIVRAALRAPKYSKVFLMSYGLLAAIALFLPSTFAAVARGVSTYADPRPSRFYFSAEYADALRWLQEKTPTDAVVLASVTDGNDIIGWAERTTYAGHWANTLDLDRKEDEIARFFGASSDAERAQLLEKSGATYVFWGPRERAFGGAFKSGMMLGSAYKSAHIEIFEVRR